MPNRFFLDARTPPSRAWPPATHLSENTDAGLLHTALERWRHASSGLRELFAGVPSTQRALSAALERQLDLGEPEIGLRFSASELHPEQVVGLAQAWAFVHKHPNLAAALDRPCVVTGLGKQHPLSTLTPLQLLTRLHNLDPQQALEQGWNAHWDRRAPGTPLSRRERASQLYRIHLEATAHVALAQRTLSAEQLRPLWLLMDDTSASPQLDGQPVRAERVDLLLSNDTRVTLPDAWVISVGDSQNGAQLLYLPKQAVALQAFAKRADLQAWLGRQGLVPKGLPASDLRFEYSPRALPLTQGMTDLLSHWQQARLAALRGATPNRPGLAEHGAQVLDQAGQLDRQLSVGGVFAVPPTSFNSPSEATDDEPLWFGALHADIPWPVRKAAVARQQAALEHWSQHASAAQRQTLDQRFQTLECAEADADAAAYKLLYRERALDLVTLNREFTALHGAHKKALLAEADLQHTLKQLSDDEHQTLKHIFQLPGESEPAREGASATTEEITEKTTGNPCAASLSLSLIEQANSTRTALNGPWIITETTALNDPESPHSLLLIWPGAGGGVQRFANRRALEREVFKRHAQDAELVVQLTPISGDPLHHALHEMTFEFDEQLASLRQRYSEPAQATQLAEQLETLRQRFRAALQVPVSGARQLALAHLQEQRRSATLADNLPDWLRNLSLGTRNTLKQLIEHYIGAMQRSHALLEIALPPREPFTRQHLHERLRKDFSLKGEFDIQLDLPDSVATEKHTVPAPGAPGTPVKLVLVPSKTRSKIALLELAQQNLDNTPSMSLEPMQLRLGFLRVEATASSEAERQTLVRGITKAYLNRVLPELDLAKAYETLIRQVFMGSSDDPPFVNQHRRECLLEPWGLMLRLQGEYARLQQHISADEQRIFDAAIDGQSAEASSVILLPATLNSSGKDTPDDGPVTLAGVTFIQQASSGITLLYLPDSPDGRFLRHYSSLEEARLGLFNQCAQDTWAGYLAGRALLGNVRAHEVRIGQASEKRFNALIGVGTRWPASTTLAAHLLNVHMGRLIEAHRGTSRSNDALYLERYALNGPRAFNYLKMALGMVPFVGTTIALYDAWTSANQAAAAFLRGRVGDGVAELESVLLCLIDAAMDILPGASAGGARPSGRRPQGGQDAGSTTGIFPPAPGGDTPPQGHFSPDLNPIDSGSGTAARTDSPRPPSSSSSSRSGSPQDNLLAVMDNALHAMLQTHRRQQDSPLPFTFPVGQESRFPIRPPSRPQVWIPTPELPTPELHLPPLPTIPPVRRVLHPADSGNVMQPFKYRSEYQTQIHYRTRLREAVFEGYEYPKSLNLAGMQPGTAGAYRQVYRLAEGNFICRQDRIYEVELSQDSRGWRLSGTAQRTYKQPIALDDYGEWDTHFAVHGTTFDGGGLGGGNMLGHVANALDPLWPLAIRERLPRWWADRNLRRQQQLTREINSLAVQMDAQLPHSRKVLEQYNEATITRQISLFPTVEKTCRGDIEIAMRRYALAGELMPLSRGNKRRLLIQCMSQDAWKIADRLQVLVYCANHQTHPLLDQIDSLLQRLDLLPQDSLAERLSHLAAIRKLRVENLRQLDTIETLMGDFRLWYQRISQPADKANLRAEFDYLSARMSESNLLYIKTGNLLDMVKSYDHIKEASWLYFFRQESTLRDQVDRTLYMQYSLPQTHTTTAQRNQILQECLDTYAQFLRDMRVWTTTYPQHFHMDNVPALRAGIESMAERARNLLKQPAIQQTSGPIHKKVFTTEDGQTLIGVEHWEPATQSRQFHMPDKSSSKEVWEQGSNGGFRLQNPAKPTVAFTNNDLPVLVTEARKRLESLPAYEARVDSYARQDMLPVDLEHMLVSEADELVRRAQQLQQIDASQELIPSLRDKARELRRRGRQLRTEQSLQSKNPTDGMLTDLMGQNAVQIRKVGPLKNLGKRRDGRSDYLQEYEIHDLTKTPSELLWYAHFHYAKASPGLRDFEKAHLKLPEHRSLTHADDPSLPYADIGKQSVVLAHFENL